MTTTISIDIPRDWWLTANGRLHWADRSRRTRWLKQTAATHAAGIHLGYTRAHITAYIAYPKGATGRVDPNNAAPTTKALIDGLITAGLLPDDDATHLTGPDHRRDTNTCTPHYRIRLVITQEPA